METGGLREYLIIEKVRIDVRTQEPERIEETKRCSALYLRINQTNPTTPECQEL